MRHEPASLEETAPSRSRISRNLWKGEPKSRTDLSALLPQ